jgi:outer membrane receptor protein involved in Fe transport
MVCPILVRCVVLVAAVCAARVDAQQAPQSDVSLDSLLNTHISTASKYAQTSSTAPGSVTIVSSEDIRNFGYRNLQEVLESVRGFYVSNDRNYPYLGTRGFGRTADFNSRILMLVDGHTINDQIWGAAPIGSDLPIDLDAVERIEIVQGPGSVLYGTGAMFAVINIITKTTSALDGGIARVGLGSRGERVTSLAAGHAFRSGLAITGSGLLTNVKGGDLYYPEYDTPATNNGVVRGLDWEHGISGLGKLTWNDVTVQTGYRTRAKGVPTAQFGTLFGDARQETVDESLWGSVGLEHEWTGSRTLSARAYADRSRYRGVYPYDTGPTPWSDAAASTSVGTEVMLRWAPVSRLRLTVGTEDKAVTRAEYTIRDEAGVTSSDNAPFHVLSGFVQSEFQFLPSAFLVSGLRVDHYSTVGRATTPRLGLIVTPSAGTIVKLLYGEAFRAPSAAEALLTVGYYEGNPSLKPERISTTEIDVEQRFGDAILVSVSAYRYLMKNLIDELPAGTNTIKFENLSSVRATGIEFEVDARPSGPLSTQLSYVLQRAEDAEKQGLTNSPQQVANLGVTAHAGHGLRGAVQLRYESGRRTLASETSPFLRTDANVRYQPGALRSMSWLGGSEISLRMTNLFGVAYASPVRTGNLQDAIAADGRTYALRMEWHF